MREVLGWLFGARENVDSKFIDQAYFFFFKINFGSETWVLKYILNLMKT